MKQYLSSKTIRAALIVAVLLAIQLAGVGGPQAAETIDGLEQLEGGQVGKILDLLAILGLGGVVYGRAVAKGPLTGKKEGDE